jgi:hypothetical protein
MSISLPRSWGSRRPARTRREQPVEVRRLSLQRGAVWVPACRANWRDRMESHRQPGASPKFSAPRGVRGALRPYIVGLRSFGGFRERRGSIRLLHLLGRRRIRRAWHQCSVTGRPPKRVRVTCVARLDVEGLAAPSLLIPWQHREHTFGARSCVDTGRGDTRSGRRRALSIRPGAAAESCGPATRSGRQSALTVPTGHQPPLALRDRERR